MSSEKPFKIIVSSWGGVSRDRALAMVSHVISEGRVSEGRHGKQYCHVTTWADGSAIYASRNKASDRFVVSGPGERRRSDGRFRVKIEDWGRDHWSTFGFVVHWCMEYGKQVEEKFKEAGFMVG